MAGAGAGAEAPKRFAVVTGANKGIGFEICRQLTCNGVMVVLTARDEKRGFAALQKFKHSCLSQHVIFHPLDVTDPASISSLAHFVMNQFGKLDILVNNAGIIGAITDGEALRVTGLGSESAPRSQINWREIYTETYELAQDCIQTNYYGTKRMVQAFLPLLQLSDSPRIVNVSSFAGMLKSIPNEWSKGMLGDAESLTEERVDQVVNEFLKDFKEGLIQSKAWPAILSAYTISKSSINAYTRILANKYPSFCINCVCPGIVKTDINYNVRMLTVEEGAETPLRLALLPNGSFSGLFFS